jgi:hypothetical protein
MERSSTPIALQPVQRGAVGGAVRGPERPGATGLALLRDGERLEAWTVEGNGDYQMTVASAFAFVEAVLAHPPDPGVQRAQDAFSLDNIRQTCEAGGICFVRQPV